MRNLSLIVVAALGLFAIGCKSNVPNNSPFPALGNTNNQNNPSPQINPLNNPSPLNNPAPMNNPMPMNNPSPMNNPTPLNNPTPMNNPMPQNDGGAGIAGTYRINTENFNMQLKGQTPPQEQLEQMIQQLKQALSQVSLTLNADGTYSCSGGGQTSSGRFSVNGSTLQFQEDQPSGQPLPQISIQGGQLMLHLDTQMASMDLQLIR